MALLRPTARNCTALCTVDCQGTCRRLRSRISPFCGIPASIAPGQDNRPGQVQSLLAGTNVPGLLPNVDPDGLLEYSVVYTDRAVNHMSQRFQGVMRDISRTLKQVYNAHSAIVMPGSGTFGMEAVARQFATDANCMVLRNGWFSFRWTQILATGRIAADTTIVKARTVEAGSQAAFAPAPIDEVVSLIREKKPAVVFAPHVETASGIMLPTEYMRQVSDA